MMKRYLFFGFVLAATLLIGAAQPSYALLELVKTDNPAAGQTQQETPHDNSASSDNGNVLNAVDNAELEQKRLDIQQKIEARRAAISQKLSGERAETCEAHEAGINQAVASRTATAERYLEKFKTIQERLLAFAAKENISPENAAALELIMDDKRDTASATISTAKVTTFDCAATSAATPGSIIRGLIAEEKFVLGEYRTAIKDYAAAIKAAAHEAKMTETEEAQ